MKKITCFLLFLCAGYSASSQEAQPPLVTQILLEANQTAAGYVISGEPVKEEPILEVKQ